MAKSRRLRRRRTGRGITPGPAPCYQRCDVEGAHFVGELVLLIAIAAAAAALFERLRLPAVAGFLVTGAAVGPGGLGLVGDPETVRRLAELGVVFLLFEIGLELPLDRVRQLWRRAALAGGLQVLVTLAAVSGFAMAIGVTPARAFVVGALVAMSSTALVMRVLSDRGEIDAPQGQLSVGILLFQDLCIVPLLLVVPLLAGAEGQEPIDRLWPLLRAMLALVGFFLLLRFGLRRVLDRVIALRSRDVFTLVAFLVVLGSAWVAESIGLTLAVGAFVGGLVLSASPYAYQLSAEVIPLRGVLLGIFFTAVGMLLDPRVAVDEWIGVVGYVAAVVGVKSLVIAGIVATALRQGWRLGLITGLGLAQTGEFSFVLAAVASEAGLLDSTFRQVFVAGSIVTLVATPFLIGLAPRLARWLTRGAPAPAPGVEVDRRRGHVVLLGCGFAGQTLIRVLSARGIPYVGVEANASTVQRLHARGEPVYYGDVTRRTLLEHVGSARAQLVVVTISDPVATREVVRLVRQIAPDVPVVARTRYVLQVDPLYEAGASQVVAEEFESTLEVLSQSLRVFGLPDASVAEFIGMLREEGYEPLRAPELALDPWLGEILEEVSSQWVGVESELPEGASLESLGVRARTGCSVLVVEHRGQRVPNPDPSQTLARGDRLLALGTPAEVSRLERLLADQASEEGSSGPRSSA
jgi:CPA2 family monovalent cation:H+ antiporter-2